VFLNLLTAEQQLAFARAAVFMVHVDGNIDEREMILLDQIQHETGLPEMPPTPPEELIISDLQVFESPVSKRIFLLELVGIVTADGDRHEDELEPMKSWARGLGLDPGILGSYLDLAERAHAVFHDARDLILDES
jgi:uncharacterized tellurite resistance protein B-like protein